MQFSDALLCVRIKVMGQTASALLANPFVGVLGHLHKEPERLTGIFFNQLIQLSRNSSSYPDVYIIGKTFKVFKAQRGIYLCELMEMADKLIAYLVVRV